MPDQTTLATQRNARETALDGADAMRINVIVAAHRHQPGALLPILHAVQNALGFIPGAAVPLIADALDQTRAEVHGVISFYHHFRSQPPGRHIVQVCRAEACQAVGARALEAHARQTLGIDFHETSTDGTITLEAVYCLGNCACGPSLRIDDDIIGRVSNERFDELIEALRSPAP
jgi:formate dehydrogenase subunit gamma